MPKEKKNKNKKKEVKPVFKILCEGEKTEPLYIKGYIDYFHSANRGIIVIENTKKNTPVELVKEAIKVKNNGNKNDVVWVVFDRESAAKYSDKLHSRARDNALRNGIEIAFSNICFEFWILLHFEYTAAPYSCCADLLKRSELKAHLKKIEIDDYEKNMPFLFDKVKSLVPDAITNAKNLKKSALNNAENGKEAPHFLNAYVDVHEMFEDMENFIEKKPSVREE